VRNVRVFDGERAIDRQTVVVVDGNIATIGGARVAAPHGARSIERRTPSML
jgi:imidazolonepropionase-like amidohydrolase